MNKKELIKLLGSYTFREYGDVIKFLISYISYDLDKKFVLEYWNRQGHVKSNIWRYINRLLKDYYKEIKKEEIIRISKGIKEAEEAYKNYNDKKREELKSIALRLGYRFREVNEGTACISLEGVKVTVIPRGETVSAGTSHNILNSLINKKPYFPLRGKIN